MDLLKAFLLWAKFQKQRVVFYWNWRIAPDAKTKYALKIAYLRHVRHEQLMKNTLSYLEKANFKDDRDPSWYVGTIPDNWEERIDQKIRKLEKEQYK